MFRLSMTGIICATLIAGKSLAMSPTWAGHINPTTEPVFKVSQYIENSEGNEIVVINGGEKNGLLNGVLLESYRLVKTTGPEAGQTLWIKTGVLKLEQVQEATSIARVVTNQTEFSKAFFPKFPYLMSGDFVVPKAVTLARKQFILPEISLGYLQLFMDPKAHPHTFELRPDAIEFLKTKVKPFSDSKAPLLMVEGYTDQNGLASDNQVESYQRAMTVRQFLIDELGFDETRVVAIGFGESELADRSNAPGYEANNRRVVIKAINEGP